MAIRLGLYPSRSFESIRYYTFTVNTSLSLNTGKYRIEITAQLQNYSVKTTGFDLIILTRPTSIDGYVKLEHISKDLWIEQAYNFTFEYNDTLINQRITDSVIAEYYWYRLDDDGNPLSGMGNEGEAILSKTVESKYLLDFDTELKEVGDYAIFITLQKNNFESRNAFIDLEIIKKIN